jgi:hypothetical protein
LAQNILEIDASLEQWKAALPNCLSYDSHVHPTEQRYATSPYRGGPGRLQVMLRLRYLNVKILVHRPVLRVYLLKLPFGSSNSNTGKAYASMLGKPSLKVLARCAMELIDLVDRSSGPSKLLGAWWFALYYSKKLLLWSVLGTD